MSLIMNKKPLIMKKIIVLVLGIVLYGGISAQDYSIYVFAKNANNAYVKNGKDYQMQFFLQNYDAATAQKIANLFINERGVKNVDFSKSDNNMYKVTLTLYQYADNPRYYWFLLKRNHIAYIVNSEGKHSIDDFFNIHDRIQLKEIK